MKAHPHRFVKDYRIALRYDGEPTCVCGRLESNGLHEEPPDLTDEQRALDARRVGESEN